jgi:hypothetical protein
MKMKNFNNPIGSQTRDLPAYSAVLNELRHRRWCCKKMAELCEI